MQFKTFSISNFSPSGSVLRASITLRTLRWQVANCFKRPVLAGLQKWLFGGNLSGGLTSVAFSR